MNKNTFFTAQMIDSTEQTLKDWIQKEEKVEVNSVPITYGGDYDYLKNVLEEIKAAKLKILKKHLAIKEKEFSAIK